MAKLSINTQVFRTEKFSFAEVILYLEHKYPVGWRRPAWPEKDFITICQPHSVRFMLPQKPSYPTFSVQPIFQLLLNPEYLLYVSAALHAGLWQPGASDLLAKDWEMYWVGKKTKSRKNTLLHL